ncbi:MAG: RraA family protein [Boseongicola sp. SB0677_bin_26]|nr:RraA family protein [Boseongicola sp. SB0665_bin_10]MYG25766.1 RraA family protein [Boseongicola sp. SB0677_bin_26]
MQSDTAPAGNTLDLDALARETYSAVYSDVCDTLGMRFRTLEPGARHVAGPDCVLIGHARTAISMPVDEIPERPYGGEIDFVDSLGDGDLVVLDCSRAPAAAWGELFSTASAGRGARGALIDGLTRDVAKINELDRFPVFARGARPTDALGRVAIREWDVPVCVYGLTVFPGDLVICDSDGVTVVPRKHIPEVVPHALEKASIESEARQLLLEGGYLRDVWENFRVL